MEKEIVKEKKIEAIIGILFLLLAVIGVICFIFIVNLCTDGDTCKLNSLKGVWYGRGDSSVSTTPVYFGLMAMAGGLYAEEQYSLLII